MIDLTEKVKSIRHERERQFALTFFDHDKWIHEPRFFYLSDGTKYLPDFYDAKRDAFIEVVGSRQAYSRNKDKYALFCAEHHAVNFEFRAPNGELIESSNGSANLRKPKVRYNGAIRHKKKRLKHMDGASKLHQIIDAKGLSLSSAAELCGLPLPTVSAHYYGQRKTMTLPIAAKYAKGFGIEMGELFKGGDAA